MKLTGDLKDRVEKTTSIEEAKSVIKEAGFELMDQEVETVTGGADQCGAQMAKSKASTHPSYKRLV